MVSESTEFIIGSMSQFEGLQEAEETQIVPGALGEPGNGPDHKLSAPYYGRGGMGLAMAVGTGLGTGTAPRRITSDRIPAGQVEVRLGEHVHATDGLIGKVRGLAVLTRGHLVSHILLDEGHLWGKRRVAIPIGAVAGFSDGVRLSLTRDEVRDLPASVAAAVPDWAGSSASAAAAAAVAGREHLREPSAGRLS
jgi:hypothetical protein